MDCGKNFNFEPNLEFIGFADYIKPANIDFITAHEFAFSAIINGNIMILNYIDMLAVLEKSV